MMDDLRQWKAKLGDKPFKDKTAALIHAQSISNDAWNGSIAHLSVDRTGTL